LQTTINYQHYIPGRCSSGVGVAGAEVYLSKTWAKCQNICVKRFGHI